MHLCIGMAYGFSVFWIPLTKAVGITQTVACPLSLGFLSKLTTTTCDWDKPLLGCGARRCHRRLLRLM